MKSLVFLLVLAAGLPSLAAAEAHRPGPQTAVARTIQKPMVQKSMIQEIRTTLDQARAAVAELGAERQATLDDARIEAIDQEIRRIKQETDLEIYRIQIRHFRAAGNEKAVAELEAVLNRMIRPLPVVQNPQRPAPDKPHRQ